MKTPFSILLIMLLLLSSSISSSEIFLMQQEEILGIWRGYIETSVPNHPGTYTKNKVTVTIKDKEPPLYNNRDTLEIWIQEKMTSNTLVITHQGYLTNLKEQYEATLQYDFFRIHIGDTTKYPIYLTQTASDSIKVQFSTYEFYVRN